MCTHLWQCAGIIVWLYNNNNKNQLDTCRKHVLSTGNVGLVACLCIDMCNKYIYSFSYYYNNSVPPTCTPFNPSLPLPYTHTLAHTLCKPLPYFLHFHSLIAPPSPLTHSSPHSHSPSLTPHTHPFTYVLPSSLIPSLSYTSSPNPLTFPPSPLTPHPHLMYLFPKPSHTPSLTPHTTSSPYVPLSQTLSHSLPHPSHHILPYVPPQTLSHSLPHPSHHILPLCTSPNPLTLPLSPLTLHSYLIYLFPKPSHTPPPLTPSPSYIHPPQTLSPSHLTHSPQRSDHHLLRQLSEADPLGGVSEGVWKNDRVHLSQRAQL